MAVAAQFSDLGHEAIFESPYRDTTLYEAYVKRAVDVVVASVLLVLLLPTLLLAAAAVRVSLGRGVLFRQRRIGFRGAPFTIYKFRTMRPDRRRAHRAHSGPDRRRCHKTPNDPRTTRAGRLLRALSIDELPQLFNVLKGDMSLVGPRPEMLEIVAQYEPWQHGRHAVRPGITGPWQVGDRCSTLMHEATGIDLDYVDQVSLGTDLRLLARTVPAVVLRRGF
ncbi:MAG: sugar transferase [Acidimicrobiales bacterium]|nr:sugar transferase [Acidimicrobiales bacterium]